jgi:transcriptional regulator with XRE-family HTH domain
MISEALWKEAEALHKQGLSLKNISMQTGISPAWLSGNLNGKYKRLIKNPIAPLQIEKWIYKKADDDFEKLKDKVNLIKDRHRNDWNEHHTIYILQKIADDFEFGKSAKITSEILTIQQKGELASWGFNIYEFNSEDYDISEQVENIKNRHREDWEVFRGIYTLQRIANDFEIGKSAKITAEMLTLRQRGESIAWGINNEAMAKDLFIENFRSD